MFRFIVQQYRPMQTMLLWHRKLHSSDETQAGLLWVHYASMRYACFSLSKMFVNKLTFFVIFDYFIRYISVLA